MQEEPQPNLGRPNGRAKPIESDEFLALIRGQAGPFDLAAKSPNGVFTGRRCPNRQKARQYIEQQRACGADTYYHVNSLRSAAAQGQAKKAEVAGVDWVHLDKDPPRAAVDAEKWCQREAEKLLASDCPPNAIILSGRGLHALWRLKDRTTVARGEAVNKALIDRFGGDRGTWNANRLLRVPGTLNRKYNPPARCEVLHSDGGAYDIEDLERQFVLEAPAVESAAASENSTARDDEPGEAEARALLEGMPGYQAASLTVAWGQNDRSSRDFAGYCDCFRAGLTPAQVTAIFRLPDVGAKFSGARLRQDVERAHRRWLAEPEQSPQRAGGVDSSKADHFIKDARDRREANTAPPSANVARLARQEICAGKSEKPAHAKHGEAKPEPEKAEEQVKLTGELPPQQPFPAHALGQVLEPVVRVLHERVVQAPLSMCATAALPVVSSAVQHLADVEIPRGERLPLSLFALIPAKSGERKSSLDRRLSEGIKRFQGELYEEYAAAKKDYEKRLALFNLQRQKAEAEIKGRKDLNSAEAEAELLDKLGEPPEEPTLPDIIARSPTIEFLERRMLRGRLSQAIISAEGASFLSGYSMSETQVAATAARLNALWDGDGPVRERITETSPVSHRPDARLSVSLSTQPDNAHRAWSNRVLIDIGFHSRILPCEPESAIGTRTGAKANAADFRVLERFADTIYARAKLEAGEDRVIRFDEEATQAFEEFYLETERAQGKDGPYYDITGFGSKMPEHASRIAGDLLLLRDPYARVIDAELFWCARLIVRWYAVEHLRLHGISVIEEKTQEAEELRTWLVENWRQRSGVLFSPTDIKQHGPNRFRKRAPHQLRELIHELEKEHVAKRKHGDHNVPQPNGKSVRRIEVYQLIGGGA